MHVFSPLTFLGIQWNFSYNNGTSQEQPPTITYNGTTALQQIDFAIDFNRAVGRGISSIHHNRNNNSSYCIIMMHESMI